MLRAELTLSLVAKAVALAAIGLMLFRPADRPAVDPAGAGARLVGGAP